METLIVVHNANTMANYGALNLKGEIVEKRPYQTDRFSIEKLILNKEYGISIEELNNIKTTKTKSCIFNDGGATVMINLMFERV